MRRKASRPAVLLLLAAGLVAAREPAAREAEADAALRLPYTVERIWFRTGKKKLAGDLTITPTALEFSGRKRNLTVPMESIQVVSYGTMRGDVDTEWTVLSVLDGGVEKTFGLRDGRKFGFGVRTREIYETVKRAVRTLSAAQYRVPPGWRPYVEMDHQFTLAIPEDWSSTHLLVVVEEGHAVGGTIVFSAVPIPRGVEPGQGPLADVVSGDAVAVVLERRRAAGGMTCDGFTAGGRAKLLEWIEQLPPAIERERWAFEELPTVEQATIDDCVGLRVVRNGRNPAGRAAVLDVRAVTRGRTAFLFVLRSVEGEQQARGSVFERILSTVRFSAATGLP